jgi:serine/threonine-protein kinase
VSTDLRQGDTIAGKYVVDSVIGSGGMGFVVLATHPILGACAIKLLHPDYAKNAEIVARFVREAQAAQKIQNEHVVRVSDVGVDPERGVPYIVMERLKGNDLAHALQARGPLQPEEAVEYVLQACEALVEAHLEGIVHRDLKPANLFVTTRRDGSPFVKVLDFGISKMAVPSSSGESGLTRTTGIMGTVLYMSPEQLQRPKEVDARSDVWALGVILYELLSGRLPFVGEDMPNTITKVMLEEPVPLGSLRPSLPTSLLAVVERCLRKDRNARFAGVGELVSALAEVAPARARISIERVVSVTGGPRPAQAIGPSTDAQATAQGLATAPFAAAQTTTSGAVSASPASSSTVLPNTSRAPLVVGALVLLVVGAVGIGFAMRRPTKGPTATGARATPDVTRVAASAEPALTATVSAAATSTPPSSAASQAGPTVPSSPRTTSSTNPTSRPTASSPPTATALPTTTKRSTKPGEKLGDSVYEE